MLKNISSLSPISQECLLFRRGLDLQRDAPQPQAEAETACPSDATTVPTVPFIYYKTVLFPCQILFLFVFFFLQV